MFVGANLAGLSNSETADLLGFPHTAIFRVYKEFTIKEKLTGIIYKCTATITTLHT